MAPTLTSELWRALAEVDGFAEGASIFSDDDRNRAYFVNGTEVAHLHERDELELRLTRKVISANRPRLKPDTRVDLRRSGSDWIELQVSRREDIAFALELAEMAAAAHRPPPGVTAKGPPVGAELARRRRFH